MSDTSVQSTAVKLVFLGESAVGKSSIVARFVHSTFSDDRGPTIGAAFFSSQYKLPDRTVKLNIWDTAGQERFASLAPMYLRNAGAAIIVYDVTQRKTFEKAQAWVKTLRSDIQASSGSDVIIALVGNKTDLLDKIKNGEESGVSVSAEEDTADESAKENNKAAETAEGENSESERPEEVLTLKLEDCVPKEEAAAYAASNNLLFFQTSALMNGGVTDVFGAIAERIPAPKQTTRADGIVDLAESVAGGNRAAGGDESCAC